MQSRKAYSSKLFDNLMEVIVFKSFFLSRKWAPKAYGFLALLLLVIAGQLATGYYHAKMQNTMWTIIIDGHDKHAAWDFFTNGAIYLALLASFAKLGGLLKWTIYRISWWWREAASHDYIDTFIEAYPGMDALRQRMQESVRDAIDICAVMLAGLLRALGNLFVFFPMVYAMSIALDEGSSKYVALHPEILLGWERFLYKENLLLYVTLVYFVIGLAISIAFARRQVHYENVNSLNEGAYGSVWERLQLSRGGFRDLHSQLKKTLSNLRNSSLPIHKRISFFEVWTIAYQFGWVIIPFLGLGWYVFAGVIGVGIWQQTKSAMDELNNAGSFFPTMMPRISKMLSDLRLMQQLAQKVAQKARLRIAAE